MTIRHNWPRAAGLVAWVIYCAALLVGLPSVPFHPDEATYLFMSRDFDLLFLEGRPSAVTWQAASATDPVRRYRLLDPSLAHYLPGLGRLFTGFGGRPLPVDWNWNNSWQLNVAAGALPDIGLLVAGRLPAALLTAVSPLFIFGIGRRMHGSGTGALAAVLFALNSLVLLHGRRAMSEGPLLFAIAFGMWLCLRPRPRPVVAGVGAAAALAAKLTGLVLLPVAISSIVWQSPEPGGRPAVAGSQSAPPASRLAVLTPGIQWRLAVALLVSFLVTSAALSPALWASPVAGLRAMAAARQRFTDDTQALLHTVAPSRSLASPLTHALAAVYHVFYAPLAFADVGNYSAQTLAAEAAYSRSPLNTLLHTTSIKVNLITGTVLLSLALFGLGQAVLNWRTPPASVASPERLRVQALVALWTFVSALVVLMAPVAWQRYYLPLVPPASLWAAYGVGALARLFARLSARRSTAHSHVAT